jgi:hypothetical protein
MSRRHRKLTGRPLKHQSAKRAPRVAFGMLDREVDQILGRALREHEPPTTLTHYTRDVANVQKILGSGVLRATLCTAATGGAEDLEVATRTVVRVLDELEAEHPPVAKYSLGWSCGAVRTNYSDWKIAKRAQVYVVCFTPVSDNADMWASEFGGYGQGASIELLRLPEEHKFSDRDYRLYEVEYNLARLHAALKAEMTQVLDAAKRFLVCDKRHGIVGSGLLRLAAVGAMLAKSPSCAFQKEWRVVIVPHEGVNIETSGPREPARTDFPLRVNPADLPAVVRIVLGPNNPPEKVEEVRAQLAALGYGAGKGDMPELVISTCAPVGAKPAA